MSFFRLICRTNVFVFRKTKIDMLNMALFSSKPKKTPLLFTEEHKKMLSENVKESYQEFQKLSPEVREKIFEAKGLGMILKLMPQNIQRTPNFHFFLYLIWNTVTHHMEDDEYPNNDFALEEMSTNLPFLTKVQSGIVGTPTWRQSFIGGNFDEFGEIAPEYILSPWHDVALTVKGEKDPAYLNDYVTRLQMFVTVPRESSFWNKITKDERMNPLRHQITKSGGAARLENPAEFNVGIMPQTWCDPRYKCSLSDIYSFNDPIMAVDISGTKSDYGVKKVKLISAIGAVLEESNRILWFMVVCNSNDPISQDIENISDADDWLPGCKENVRNFLAGVIQKFYGRFSFYNGGKFCDLKSALRVLKCGNLDWVQLVKKEIPPPKTIYYHHPQVRSGKMAEIESVAPPESRVDHALGLSLEERVKKKWETLDQKLAFFRIKYLEHSLGLEQRKNALVGTTLKHVSSSAFSTVEAKIRLEERMNPPPKKSGMDYLFRHKLESEDEMMRSQLNAAQKRASDQVSEESGLLRTANKNTRAKNEFDLEKAMQKLMEEGLEGPDRDKKFQAELKRAFKGRISEQNK